MEMNLNVGFLSASEMQKWQTMNLLMVWFWHYFCFLHQCIFIFASSKMFWAIKGWDYYFPLVFAKANCSIFTSVFLQNRSQHHSQIHFSPAGCFSRCSHQETQIWNEVTFKPQSYGEKINLSNKLYWHLHRCSFQEKLNSVSMSL